MTVTHYVGFDVHKKSVQYCVKSADGEIVAEGKLRALRPVLVEWARQRTEPWHGAMEAALFSGWIYDTLEPYAAELNMAHPLMMKAIGALAPDAPRALFRGRSEAPNSIFGDSEPLCPPMDVWPRHGAGPPGESPANRRNNLFRNRPSRTLLVEPGEISVFPGLLLIMDVPQARIRAKGLSGRISQHQRSLAQKSCKPSVPSLQYI